MEHATIIILLVTCLFVKNSLEQQQQIDLDFSIFENIGRNAYVGNVASGANLQDRVPPEYDDTLNFQILEQNNEFAEYFYINSQNGDLRTNKAIDREDIRGCASASTCVLDIRVVIVSDTNPDFTLFQIVDCHITIQDQNDNSPEFDDSQITIDVPEDARVGSKINMPRAYDPDSPQYGISHYTLISTSVPEFGLVQSNGSDSSVYLEVQRSLDRETKPSYRVVIAAYDGGSKSGTLAVDINIIDVNDNPPRFTQSEYTVSVSEDFRVNNVVIRVTAVDEDSGQNAELEYALDSRSQAAYGDLFSINNSTGEIILIGELDYEQMHQIILDVTAKEKHRGTLPVEAKVIINVLDVNDNAPIITVNAVTQSGSLEITENAPVGTVIGLISTEDPDSGEGGRYSCSLENNQDNSFELTATSSARSDFKIATNSNFNREIKAQYDLNFVCTDRGSPSRRSSANIRVTILDENDNAPSFSQQVYNVSVTENNPPGMFLLQVRAVDEDFGQNGQVEYALYAEAMVYISVDPASGNVTAKVPFDYEKYHVLSFGIIARDKGAEAHATTAILNIHIINENDEPPAFDRSTYEFELTENGGIMASTGQVQIQERDPELAKVIFEMEESSGYSNLFMVESESGKVFARTSFDADSSSSNVYQFYVLAIDSENTNLRSQAFVVIKIVDTNDNAPNIQFPGPLNSTVQIGNDFPSGDVVTTIIASDKDFDANYNSKLRYILETGDESHYFSCNEHTGEVRTIRELRGVDDMIFRLTITVQDMGTPSLSDQATLIITVNQSLSRSPNHKTESLVENDNLTIVTTVAVISGILIVFLIVAIVVLKRKDQIKLHHKQKRIAKLFSSQKIEVNSSTANKAPTFDSLDGVKEGYTNDVSTADEYQLNEPQNGYSKEKNHKVKPWLDAHVNMKENADVSDLSDQSLASDSGRGSHEDPDLTRHLSDVPRQLHSAPPRGRNLSHDVQRQHSIPAMPPKSPVYYAGSSHSGPPEIPERGHRPLHSSRQRRDSHDSYVQLSHSHKPPQIAPDHKLLYRQPVSSAMHNISSQSSGYSSNHNYQLQIPQDDAFVLNASYI